MAVGYPGGGELDVSSGRVVDAIETSVFGRTTEALRVTNPIRRGDSGGPLLDEQGRVVGVVFAYQPDSGHGLAVPIDAL